MLDRSFPSKYLFNIPHRLCRDNSPYLCLSASPKPSRNPIAISIRFSQKNQNGGDARASMLISPAAGP